MFLCIGGRGSMLVLRVRRLRRGSSAKGRKEKDVGGNTYLEVWITDKQKRCTSQVVRWSRNRRLGRTIRGRRLTLI